MTAALRLAELGRAAGLPLRGLLLAAIALHVGVTLRAANPWHGDEHFQILEFAWARAGLAPLAELPWEFDARIRSSVQPALAMALLEALRAAGLTSPFAWALALRLGTLALAFTVTLHVCAHVAPTLERAGRRTLWLAALLLWFAPLLTSRFTSENWSGLALAAAIPLLESDRGRAGDLSAGALLGLAFVFRFQAAFAILALVAWLLVQGAAGRERTLGVVAAALSVLAGGVLCDVWFYGEGVFTPWEYLRTNLVEGVAAARFGVEPWYWYLEQAPLSMVPPLGFALAALCAASLLARPRSPWVWAFVAFVAGHSLIAHKELRFLFPMLYVLPVLLAIGVDALVLRLDARASRALGLVLATQNAAVATVLLTPSIHRHTEFDAHLYRFLWEAAEARPSTDLFVVEQGVSAYRAWGIEMHVYRHPRVRTIPGRPGDALEALLPPGTPADRVLIVTLDRRGPELAGPHGYDLVYAAEPGYRGTARALGLERSALIAWLERVDRWTDSQWVRHVYAVTGKP